MSYSTFTLERVVQEFSLTRDFQENMFLHIKEIIIPDRLKENLEENVPLALAVHTEKVRSELIVAPILVELRRMLDRKISMFSGIEFNVAPKKGLKGVCDFIISQSLDQYVLLAPAIAIVEAKKDSINDGLGQCVAEMIAMQIFNENKNNSKKAVYGIVTTGSIWKFLRLEDTNLIIDEPEYYLKDLDKIMGIMISIVKP